MHAHTHLDLSPCKRLLGFDGCLYGTVSRGKSDEEGIGLCVDLDTAVALKGLTQETAVLAEGRRLLCSAQLLD